jgi:hypothetical protein
LPAGGVVCPQAAWFARSRRGLPAVGVVCPQQAQQSEPPRYVCFRLCRRTIFNHRSINKFHFFLSFKLK